MAPNIRDGMASAAATAATRARFIGVSPVCLAPKWRVMLECFVHRIWRLRSVYVKPVPQRQASHARSKLRRVHPGWNRSHEKKTLDVGLGPQYAWVASRLRVRSTPESRKSDVNGPSQTIQRHFAVPCRIATVE